MGKLVVECFLLEETDKVQEYLRRYSGVSEGKPRCPKSGVGYHNAKAILVPECPKKDDTIVTKTSKEKPFDSEKWPTTCSCGYEFVENNFWQHGVRDLYRRTDTGELVTLMDAPVGAMWYADWMSDKYRGPDGRCLVVRTPAGDWMPDLPSSDGTPWKRSGTPPKVTARPSIGMYGPDGKKWLFHGWLTDGVLKEC